MSSQKIFFLSDIHIGTNQPTNWYAQSFHEPFLVAALEHIAAQADAGLVDELILLGDVVDQWMYVPTEKPPSFQEITAANPTIFSTVLPETVSAVVRNKGKATYLNGNHDMAVTEDDIHSVSGDIGYVSTPLYVPESGGGQIVCTHGNLFSLFNAPNVSQHPPGSSGLPLGFFVSRLAARWASQQGKPAYQQPNTGDPNGVLFDTEALEGLFKSLFEGRDDLASLIMSALLQATNNQDDCILMADGSTVAVADVGTIYSDAFSGYPKSTGVDDVQFGMLAAESALLESDAIDSLSHFAKELAESYTMIVMGHTHVPVEKFAEFLFNKKGLYANSGFMCPSQPDVEAGRKHPTFAEITVDTDKRQLIASIHMVVLQDGKYEVKTDIASESIGFR